MCGDAGQAVRCFKLWRDHRYRQREQAGVETEYFRPQN
jgi:hypothetical protein